MIIWLASFPRSGNTLLRMMLREVFGLVTHSKYEAVGTLPPEQVGFWTDDPIGRRIGARLYSQAVGWRGFSRRARESDRMFVIKTHDPPEGEGKAIYVVRNGLVATDSYRHFLGTSLGRKVGWAEVAGPSAAYATWSSHLESWQPRSRPETLLVRYELLLREPELAVELLSDFMGLPPVGRWSDPWSEVHASAPNFFRRGKTTVPETVTLEEIELFMSAQSSWMDRLGYAEDVRTEIEVRNRAAWIPR